MARGGTADDDAHASIVGYGAFLLLSSAAVSESIERGDNIEIVHVVVTNAADVCSVYGDVSDQIDITLGTILRTLTRSTDLIGRVSGSSYSILMEGAPHGAGLHLADRIVRAAESYNAIRGLDWPIDVSCEVLDGAAVQQLSDVFDITV
ncbi:MAG: hypothetical protein R2733_00650 [Acidimicrobiales bacterium]